MNNDLLISASRKIAQRNLTASVAAVTVLWEEKISKLTVTYYIDGHISDDEEEECSITYAEIISEFPEIMLGDAKCIGAHSKLSKLNDLEELVYIRKLKL
jgi:hypothetical protein